MAWMGCAEPLGAVDGVRMAGGWTQARLPRMLMAKPLCVLGAVDDDDDVLAVAVAGRGEPNP